jgi:hypothetical protein
MIVRSEPGVYIMERKKPPPWGGGEYQPTAFGGKNMIIEKIKRGKM